MWPPKWVCVSPSLLPLQRNNQVFDNPLIPTDPDLCES